ncbi:MAG: YfhO family protein [Alistipes sp.]|nr:YfhO family protein [Alistipes sp.]
MNIKDIFMRGILPAVVAATLFWVVSATLFSAQLEGKSLSQGDTRQYTGMWRDIKECREQTGEDPQWTGAMFSGMPAYLVNVEYPSQAVKHTLGQVIHIVDEPMSLILFAMVAMWIALLLMGINPWIGMVGALAYGLSTYFLLIIDAGHITKMRALVYAPLVVAGVWYTLRRNMWVGGVVTAVALSLEIGANHPQITYYFALAAAALWISEMWFAHKQHAWRGFARRTAVLAVAALLAAGSNFSPLWYTMQHQKYTTRGGSELAESDAERKNLSLDYATAWSYGKAESLNMLIPGMTGGSSAAAPVEHGEVEKALKSLGVSDNDTETIMKAGYFGGYWGDQPGTAGPTYLGAAAIMLAAVGLTLTRGRNKWWIVAVSILSLLLAWGSNFMGFTELAFKILPGYAKFRTVSMALVVVEWSVPLLAALALRELWRTEMSWRQVTARVAACGGTLILVSLAVLALTGGFGSDKGPGMIAYLTGDSPETYALHDALVADRKTLLATDVWRTIGFIAATGAAIAVFARLRSCDRLSQNTRKALPYALTLATGILVVWDLAGVDRRFFNDDNFQDAAPTEIRPTAADREILRDKDPGYRVMNLDVSTYNDATTSYFHRSIGGYHGAKLGRYQDLIDVYAQGGRKIMEPEIAAMLNCRYIIYDGEAVTLAEAFGVEPLGAAWFVAGTQRQSGARNELTALGRTDLATTAVVGDDAPVAGKSYDATGTITLSEYQPNRLKYEYSSEGEALAVFSEIYFPDGWTASIDGKEAPYFRVDYLLRGMELPAGRHTVEWRFRAPGWAMAEGITQASSLAILAACAALIAAAAWHAARRRRNSKTR